MRGRLRKGERQERIVALLRAKPTVRIAALAREFAVSAETVRRDLDELSRAGAVSRTYGGAARTPVGQEAAIGERLRERVAEREAIARRAAALAGPAAVAMIDGGSTTIHLARALAADERGLTVMTNSLGVATTVAANPAIRVVLCPGDYNPHEGIVTGAETLAFLDRFHADIAFIGAGGMTEDGVSEVDPGAAWVKRRMIARAKRRVLLLDASKFGTVRYERVCGLDEIDELVTDRAPPPKILAAARKAGLRLTVAEPAPGLTEISEGGGRSR